MMAHAEEVTKPTVEEPNDDNKNDGKKRRKRKRWGDAPPQPAQAPVTTAAGTAGAGVMDPKAKALALQESIRAKLAALKGQSAGVAPPKPRNDAAAQPPIKRAKHYDLDMTTTGPTFTTIQPILKARKKTKPSNPYLAHQEEDEEAKDHETTSAKNEQNLAKTNSGTREDVDERLVRASKPRKQHKAMVFIEPGTFVELAERKRQRAANAAQSGFVSGRKAGMYVESTGMASVYGSTGTQQEALLPSRVEASDKSHMPLVMEWWDMELLPTRLKKSVATQEGVALSKQTQAQLQQLDASSNSTEQEGDAKQEDNVLQQLDKQCWEQASLSHSKTCTLVQHIVPIKPPGAVDGPAKQPTLHLTKRELKRQRKRRREEKQRKIQDMQAVGLIPAPEPRLTLKNFIQVLGDQAVLDPSQMEQKVMEQVQARQRAHLQRNEERKLTKEQRREKKISKLTEDTSQAVSVAIFFVKDMGHTYHRTKVDLNAQQNYITGGVLECSSPPLACVICEGGPKAVKRYTRLMMVRMNWTGEGLEELEEEEEENEDGETANHKFNPENKCELVWTGMASKRMFSSFVFQSCETAAMARKVLEAKGVAHFWDQVMTHATGESQELSAFKLGDDNEDDEIVMMEE